MVQSRRLGVVFVLAALLLLPIQGWADDDHVKLDRALREAVRKGSASERVIIRTKPGFREGLRQVLQAHGDEIENDHPSIDALTAQVHGADLAALASDPAVESVSVDAVVTAH